MGSLKKKKKSLASANNLLDRWVGTEGDKAVASTGGGTWCGILVRLIEYLLADSTRTRRKKKTFRPSCPRARAFYSHACGWEIKSKSFGIE